MDQYFLDRQAAGRKLARKISTQYKKKEGALVLGLPRGGVVIAGEVAKKMGWPLDIMVTRKIGHPNNSEYAVAAVSEHEIVLNPNEEIDPDYILNQSIRERREILRRTLSYRPSPKAFEIKNKTVFLIDDGIATGLTMKAAIVEARSKDPKRLVVAAPVASSEIINQLQKSADEIIVLETPSEFYAVGQFYKNFPQVTDSEVVAILRRARSLN